MSTRILFIAPHRPQRNPSQRFRMEQYFPYLRECGFECDYSWFIDERDDRIFYSSGNGLGKLGIFLKAIRIRLGDVLKAGRYDVIFVHREAFMTGSTFFEKQLARSNARLIFDFDDAIWLADTSPENNRWRWLKREGKTADLIRMADAVIAGNSFLAAYAADYNQHVTIIPTVVDTTHYLPQGNKPHQPVSIGWIGSRTTVKHLAALAHPFRTLQKKYGSGIRFIQISDRSVTMPDVNMENIAWSAAGEVSLLNQMDVGVMPLPDETWSKGKCAFKAIQYMALSIPPVLSPVGMNCEVVQQGVNGLFAGSDAEWVQQLSCLLDDASLRTRLGAAARQMVVERYSVQSQLETLCKVLQGQL